MKHILTKISDPGFEKVFSSEEDARDELRGWICKTCIYEIIRQEVPEDDLDIFDLLFTACGAEFLYEEE